MRKNKNKRNIKEDEIFPIFNHKHLYKKRKNNNKSIGYSLIYLISLLIIIIFFAIIYHYKTKK